LDELGLSINDLVKLLEENFGLKDIRDSITTLIERGYTSSSYLDPVCDVLKIYKEFLIRNSDYIYNNSCNIKWCFETLSRQNQFAVTILVAQLTHNNIDAMFQNISTIGIAED